MANMFSGLKSNDVEAAEDRLGGGYNVLDTDIYTGKVKAFYAGKAASEANSITVILAGGDFKDEYRETIYFTSGKAKGGTTYYVKDGKKYPLPGFTIVDQMCLATIGKSILDDDFVFEDKVMNIYDPELKKEAPKNVPMATEMLGQEVSVAILKTKENQTEKDNQGNYVPKADGSTRETNNIDKVFNTATHLTVSEAMAAQKAGVSNPEAKFWEAWLGKNKGQVRDKTESTSGGGNQVNRSNGGNAGGPPASGGAGNQPARTSLFGKN